jgi:hypothetical protein
MQDNWVVVDRTSRAVQVTPVPLTTISADGVAIATDAPVGGG